MMEGVRPGEYKTNNDEAKDNNNKMKKKGRTGGKLAKRVVSVVLAGAVFAGGFAAYHGYKHFRSDQRAKSLIEAYTNEEGFCTLPSEVTVNKAYDIVYTSGSSLAKYLEKNEVKYCEVLDEYYTIDGSEIAILTFSSSTHVLEPATKVSYDGFEVYMAPEGYVLDGKMCYKDTDEQIVKVVPKNPNGYSNYALEGYENAELIDVREVTTQPFSSIVDLALICDVPDSATLNEENECTASLKLAQRK